MIITSNRKIAKKTYEMVLHDEKKENPILPGQFINIKMQGFYLRRPISVADFENDHITIVYRTIGGGTREMSKLKPGQNIDVLSPLGNGYNIALIPSSVVLIGGGCGVPPMYYLAKKLKEAGRTAKIILGFKSCEEIFWEQKFHSVVDEVVVFTEDGSYGEKGLVTDAFDQTEYICACGPESMLKALHCKSKGGQYSFEARMGCGFGACMGCSCETVTGNKRICKEGPVLLQEEIIW